MAAEIKNLDTDLQMLVYENYNKFISATDTIKRWGHIFTVIAHCSPSCSDFDVLLVLYHCNIPYISIYFPAGWRQTLLVWRQTWNNYLERLLWCTDVIDVFFGTYLNQPVSVFFCQITSVQSKSDTVNTSLFNKRENIEKLHRTRNLLRKVQVNPVLFVLFFSKT